MLCRVECLDGTDIFIVAQKKSIENVNKKFNREVVVEEWDNTVTKTNECSWNLKEYKSMVANGVI